MRPLAPRERRLVAVGILVGLLAAVWFGLIAPVIGGFQSRAERRAQFLARFQIDQRLLAAIPTLRLEADDQRRTAALYQITAPSPALAAEALKARVAAALTDVGGAVADIEPIQADVPPGWISLRADAQINLTQLVAAVRRLENEAPYVVVDYASFGADRALRSGHAAPLDARLQISALFHPAQAQ
jgi:general secretion pathway protein M